MSSYVVVGAGPVGCGTARLLADEGHSVVLTSRNAGSINAGAVRRVSADATDAQALARIGKGADTIFMCAMAAYDRWPTDFFPIIDGTVRAAEQVGARIVVLGNTYGYGERAVSPLTADMPLDPTTRKGTVRTLMWQRALRSEVPAIEVRASDYLGHGAISYFSLLILPALLAGRDVAFPGDPDAVHAWSFTRDVARTLVAASQYRGEWDRAFHVPSLHISPRDLAERFAAARKTDTPGWSKLTAAGLEAGGFHDGIEMTYLFDKSCVLDASDTEKLLGVKASSLDVMIEDTLRG
jgi:nucleoside-diphosphate-sugar epimerase